MKKLIQIVSPSRCVVGEPFTFSDGLTIPVGTRIAFAAQDMQRDPELVSGPQTFDGFRYVKMALNDSKQDDGAKTWAASQVAPSNLAQVTRSR